MSIVQKLDVGTINKIAAGEVLERPASCVKELVENAIDAGATRIEVEIREGGKSYIRVTDNGVGMNSEDANLSICRHATSKINNASDLMNISTLGFRGEALPTITAVSRFRMTTKVEDDEYGTRLEVEGGVKKNSYEIDSPDGTTIQVRDLFYNTPARQKFMKTATTEANKIHDYIVKLAFSRPKISFKLINGGRNVLQTSGNGELFDTITNVYGYEMAESLIKIDFTDKNDEHLKITGYVSKPNKVKSYRGWQTYIVNGRIVSNRIIMRAVDEAYRAMIPKSGYPFVLLKIEVLSDELDVNVHPQKIEVRFKDESKVYRAIYAAVKKAVEGAATENELAAIAAEADYFSKPKNNKINDDFINKPPIRTFDETVEMLSKNLTDEIDETTDTEYDLSDESVKTSQETNLKDEISTFKPIIEQKLPEMEEIPAEQITPLGQIDYCYIIARDRQGMYIVDQHAAHERILFDRFNGYSEQIPAQQLLVHQIIKFDEHETQIIENNLELFGQLGFTLEASGEREYRLIEMPVDMSENDGEEVLREVLTNLPPSITNEELAQSIRQKCISTMACRAAIKAGQELNLRQMQMILDQLAQTTQPYTCPHGRPTILRFTNKELAKMFKRT